MLFIFNKLYYIELTLNTIWRTVESVLLYWGSGIWTMDGCTKTL